MVLSLGCFRACSLASSALDRGSAWRTEFLTLVHLPPLPSCAWTRPMGSASACDWLKLHEPARWSNRNISILVPEAADWMFWSPVFGVNSSVSRLWPFFFNTLEVFQGELPPAVMSEGGCGKVIGEQLVLCLQIAKYADLASKKRR